MHTAVHCNRFAHGHAKKAFNLVKNQSRGHAKKVIKCSSTSKRVRAHKSREETFRLAKAKVETRSLRPREQNDCNGKRPLREPDTLTLQFSVGQVLCLDYHARH